MQSSGDTRTSLLAVIIYETCFWDSVRSYLDSTQVAITHCTAYHILFWHLSKDRQLGFHSRLTSQSPIDVHNIPTGSSTASRWGISTRGTVPKSRNLAVCCSLDPLNGKIPINFCQTTHLGTKALQTVASLPGHRNPLDFVIPFQARSYTLSDQSWGVKRISLP